MKKTAVYVVATVALLALAAAVGGCSGGSSSGQPNATASPQWEQVLTAHASGAEPIKLNLGTHTLGDGARLGWVLSGPTKNPPVVLTFRIINATNGVGYGNTMSSGDATFSTTNENGIVLTPILPGKYVVFFSQRFPTAEGPGYDAQLTVSTFKNQQ